MGETKFMRNVEKLKITESEKHTIINPIIQFVKARLTLEKDSVEQMKLDRVLRENLESANDLMALQKNLRKVTFLQMRHYIMRSFRFPLNQLS